ncbi:MAG: hypothetical protein ACC656_05625 [Candidatus Heimdallarchaeota archaeon]
MNEPLFSDTSLSGDPIPHPLINKDEILNTVGNFVKQRFIAPHHLAPFSCTNCSSSNANYTNLIKIDLLNSIADVSNSIYDITQELALISKVSEQIQDTNLDLIPDAEYFLTVDVPDKSRIPMQAKIKNIRKASPELGLPDYEWALLSEEDNG